MASFADQTYGNWRRVTSWGLGEMSTAATATIWAALLVTVLTFMTAPLWVALIPSVITVGLFAAFWFRDRDYWTLGDRLVNWVLWQWRKLRGEDAYRSGPLSHLPVQGFHPPGVASSLVLLPDGADAYGRPFALLELPHADSYAVSLAASPGGDGLIDPAQLDQWINGYAQFLTELSNESSITAVKVVVDEEPDSGALVQRVVRDSLADDAPEVSRQVAMKVAETQGGHVRVRAYVTFTFAATTAGGVKRDREDMYRDIGAVLPELTAQLSKVGIGAPVPMTGLDVCETIRSCWDPEAGEIIERERAMGHRTALTWDQVGPVATETAWSAYKHDSGVSMTWFMTRPPSGAVPGRILKPVLTPHAVIDRKRVCLMYRPLDFITGQARVEQAKNKVDFDLTKTTRPSTRKQQERAQVEATATEESWGASILEFSLAVTVTLRHEHADMLADARAVMEQRFGKAKLLMRPAWGMHDAAFVATLPIGVGLQSHFAFTRFSGAS